MGMALVVMLLGGLMIIILASRFQPQTSASFSPRFRLLFFVEIHVTTGEERGRRIIQHLEANY
jgi:hypothetical protein